MKKYIVLFLLLISVAKADSYLGFEYYRDKNSFTEDKFTAYNTRYVYLVGMKTDDFRFEFGFGIGQENHNHTYSYKTLLLNAYYNVFKFDNFDIFGGAILGLDKGRRLNNGEKNDDSGFIYGGQVGVTYKLTKHINFDIAYIYQVVENIYKLPTTGDAYEEHIDSNSAKIGVRYIF
ncbi:MAG: hypothetical protein Ta2D_02870 [Rickettsiales bacterium]|nr:MAG: hypothetical protein Ta2D_02870 [Rickettsiales bacterium]